MAQPGELSVEVAVIAQRVHLMDTNTGERIAGGVEGAQQQIGFAVGERHDDITMMLGEGHYRRRVGALRGGQCLLRVVHRSNLSARSPTAGSGGTVHERVETHSVLALMTSTAETPYAWGVGPGGS